MIKTLTRTLNLCVGHHGIIAISFRKAISTEMNGFVFATPTDLESECVHPSPANLQGKIL